MPTFINDAFFLQKGYRISTDKGLLDLPLVYQYLSGESYWAKELPYDTFCSSVQNSKCFGVYNQSGQIGFARVISDEATFAYICDVFILPSFRKNGISKWLIQTILASPELQGLRRWSLATADAHGLYQQFGFIPIVHPERWMEILKPYKQVNSDKP